MKMHFSLVSPFSLMDRTVRAADQSLLTSADTTIKEEPHASAPSPAYQSYYNMTAVSGTHPTRTIDASMLDAHFV